MSKDLRKELDRVFSTYIRLRDFDIRGFGQCISCGARNTWGELWQAGHFYSRGHSTSLYFDPKNVNGQCKQCNYHKEGNKQGYSRGLVEKYGPKILDELYLKKDGTRNWPQFYYERLIADYQQQIIKLDKEKGILTTAQLKRYLGKVRKK